MQIGIWTMNGLPRLRDETSTRRFEDDRCDMLLLLCMSVMDGVFHFIAWASSLHWERFETTVKIAMLLHMAETTSIFEHR